MIRMAVRFFSILIILVLSGGLANGINSLNYVSPIGIKFQTVFAANTISNQTSTTNIDCDPSSTCSQSNFQLGATSSGDRNSIRQNTIQENLHCHNSSICEEDEQKLATIGETSQCCFNDNSPISNDVNSHNDNSIDQQTDQKKSQL